MSILDHKWGVSREQDAVWAQVAGMDPARAGAVPLMVWRSFMDESEKDGLFVVAGYIASVEDWVKFVPKWQPLARKFGHVDKDGQWYFHMTEHIGRRDSGEYLPAFYDVIQETAFFGIVWAVKIADFRAAWDRLLAIHPSGLPVSLAGFAKNHYQWLVSSQLAYFHYLLEKGDGRIGTADFSGDTIDFIFDERSDKKGMLLAWETFRQKNKIGEKWFDQAHPRFESDKRFIPLQAADFLAGAVRNHFQKLGSRPRELMDRVMQGQDVLLDELFPYDTRKHAGHLTYAFSYHSEETLVKHNAAVLNLNHPELTVFDKKTGKRL